MPRFFLPRRSSQQWSSSLLGALVIALVPSSSGCAATGEVITDEGFEIDCRGVPCDWVIVEGNAKFKPGWIDGDQAVDMTGIGDERVIVEQRAVLLQQTTRQLLFEAAVVRAPGVELRFELEWYAPGEGFGKTFWDRAPVLLDTRVYKAWEEDVNRIQRTVLVPSESAAVIVRIVKERSGQAIVDELTLSRFTQGTKR
jgi:hypothetical protein